MFNAVSISWESERRWWDDRAVDGGQWPAAVMSLYRQAGQQQQHLSISTAGLTSACSS